VFDAVHEIDFLYISGSIFKCLSGKHNLS